MSTSMEDRHFDTFLLRNTTLSEIPSNVLANLTFLILQFEHNPYLSTIHSDAFINTNDYVRVFETSNTNLSETIFASVISNFANLLKITMLNDSVQRIPSNVFCQSTLQQLWFGIHGIATQPLKSVDSYAFYYLPSLQFLRIFSDDLSQFNKESFALRTSCDNECGLLEIHLGGRQLSSNSFPLTSLTLFGGRSVFIRFYQTPNLKYLDEAIFKPYLESDGSKSILDVAHSGSFVWGTEESCPCEMAWIQRDYFHSGDSMLIDNRVYGYPCWTYNFSSCKNI
ncbi:unnamed protein product [Rotaria sp. Silwood1]|nr:unnamed protein product [Rotaria sp. Silwood1]